MIGGDGLSRATKATLEAELPGAIATLNAEPGAQELAVPGEFYLYGQRMKPDLAIHGVAVEVSSPDQSLSAMDLAYQEADGDALVQVTVWSQGTPFEALVDRLHRYAKAVLSVLAHEDACGRGTFPYQAAVAVRAADVDPEGTQEQPVMAGARIFLRVRYSEPLAL